MSERTVGKGPDHSAFLSVQHFGSLDGLRFLCITAVIWHHAPIWPRIDWVSAIFSRGHVGVDFFFVISGFLITTLLLREESSRGKFSLRRFYWRRALRILPIYYLVVAVSSVYAIWVKGRFDQLEIVPYYLAFLSNFLRGEHIGFLAPTWSLSMEEQYYLIWPALLLLVPRRWIVPLLLVMIGTNVAAVLGAFGFIGVHGIELRHLNIRIHAPTYAPILMGSLLAIVLHRRAGFYAMFRVCGFRMAPLFFAAIVVFILSIPGPLDGLPNFIIHSLMCLLLASIVLREDNTLAPLLRMPLLVRVGQISYGIYLYHLFALVIVVKAFEWLSLDCPWVIFFGYYALAALMAEVSFRTFEAWFLSLRYRGLGR